ncbi:MAG TPA: DHCW motif cupin fold protein [Cyclobacteriaceae bacterium]|nr:DHCW motif cupin fold protein [Cyclobacteriaceae bacterium]
MNSILFHTTDWSSVAVAEYSGESGVARWRTLQYEGFRIRLVEYSKGYKADHWCKAGHMVYCLEGEMTSELSDGRIFTLSKGMSYLVSDEASMHKSYSKDGVTLLIVDGHFLSQRKEGIFNPWRF